jgi:hypothetical protein
MDSIIGVRNSIAFGLSQNEGRLNFSVITNTTLYAKILGKQGLSLILMFLVMSRIREAKTNLSCSFCSSDSEGQNEHLTF